MLSLYDHTFRARCSLAWIYRVKRSPRRSLRGESHRPALRYLRQAVTCCKYSACVFNVQRLKIGLVALWIVWTMQNGGMYGKIWIKNLEWRACLRRPRTFDMRFVCFNSRSDGKMCLLHQKILRIGSRAEPSHSSLPCDKRGWGPADVRQPPVRQQAKTHHKTLLKSS